MRLIVVMMAVIGLHAAARADDTDAVIEAREVGQIIGTSELCGYELDEGKLARYATDRLAQMPPTARALYQSSVTTHKFRISKMSDAERTTTCAMQKSLAKSYDLTP